MCEKEIGEVQEKLERLNSEWVQESEKLQTLYSERKKRRYKQLKNIKFIQDNFNDLSQENSDYYCFVMKNRQFYIKLDSTGKYLITLYDSLRAPEYNIALKVNTDSEKLEEVISLSIKKVKLQIQELGRVTKVAHEIDEALQTLQKALEEKKGT